jgi:hypothetical protein
MFTVGDERDAYKMSGVLKTIRPTERARVKNTNLSPLPFGEQAPDIINDIPAGDGFTGGE